MSKAIYDTDNDGKVDKAKNADTVNNHTVNADVPNGAQFTDTHLIDKIKVNGREQSIVNKEINIETNQGTVTIASGTTITNGYSVTLPLKYQVGNNSLEMRAESEVMQLATDTQDGHYKEVR